MHIIIMRHGEATYKGADRVLTLNGYQESQMTGLKLGSLFTINKILVSPKTRAKETCQAVLDKLPGLKPQVEILNDLTPSGDPRLVYDYVMAVIKPQENVLLITHIPMVDRLTAEFCPDFPCPRFSTSSALVLENNESLGVSVKKFITPSQESNFCTI